ncbi:MAG TPA: DUF3473 domain-containing protein [Anaerolineaceae bacterium]|nr:DUF3473 domain-containing protein [Anaerolineaceae bacterium]
MQTPLTNAFTIDLEDWYQAVTSLNARPHEWGRYEPRVERNTYRLLELMEEYGVRATFFVLGEVARAYPQLITAIADAGHEIGVHGDRHKNIQRLTPLQFAAEIDAALEAIRPLVSQLIIGHRAPYFSINARNLWALDVLWEKGFCYDSSFFATRNTLYGYPGSPRFPHRTDHGNLYEFPVSTLRWARATLPAGGGFYLRLLPYAYTAAAIRGINRAGHPAVLYLHPWELDAGHRYNRVTAREWIVQYTGRASAEAKLRRLFAEFRFAPVCHLLEQMLPEPAALACPPVAAGRDPV